MVEVYWVGNEREVDRLALRAPLHVKDRVHSHGLE
jgi:hypothetical protein